VSQQRASSRRVGVGGTEEERECKTTTRTKSQERPQIPLP
jgi:hypothetical protein